MFTIVCDPPTSVSMLKTYQARIRLKLIKKIYMQISGTDTHNSFRIRINSHGFEGYIF